jgi:transcription antitermination factor NusG
MLHLRIGDPVAPANIAPVQLGRDVPSWYCLIVRPQQEPRTAAWLALRGVASWRPTEERRVWRGGRKRVARMEYPIVPRYLFARFVGMPLWHEVRACPWITGAVGREGWPAPISDAAMGEMRGISDRLAAIRAAEARAARIEPGDRVVIETGPLAGFVVDVASIRGDVLTVLAPLLGASGVQVRLASVRKAPPGTTA